MLKSVSSITNAIGALNYKGTWNATTNTPTLASGAGTKGDYYVVSVAGTTTLDGISNWGIGDWAVFNGSVWQRVEGGADLNGVNLSVTGTTTLSGLTASTALALDASKNVVSVTNTGTGNNVLASSPSITSPTFATDTTHSYLTASSAVATDANKKLVSVTNTGTGNNVLATSPTLVTPNIGDASGTQLSIDNLRVDGNVISSLNANGVIDLLPNGTGDVRATNRLQFRSNAQDATGSLATKKTSVTTAAVEISTYNGTWGHLAVVTGLDGVGNFFTDLVFSCATAGPTVLSAKTISGGPAGRTYSMSGTDKLRLAMSSGTYDVYASILYSIG